MNRMLLLLTFVHLSIAKVNKCLFSNVDRVNFLFNIIDNSPKDDYLYYNELYAFQKFTEPNQALELTPEIYIQLTKLFGADPHKGLTLQEFNSSYYQYRNELGTDLDKDFNIIFDYIYKHYGRSI